VRQERSTEEFIGSWTLVGDDRQVVKNKALGTSTPFCHRMFRRTGSSMTWSERPNGALTPPLWSNIKTLRPVPT
jgi:hypothetical protein